MRIKNLHVPNSRLTEGSYHNFKILKRVSLGGDIQASFIMQDPLGYKVMMPADYYQKYGFEPGQEIRCRVDRINCNGRMFLEPQHPFYNEGESYEFSIKGKGNRQNLTGETENYFYVEDTLGYEWKVRSISSTGIYESNGKIKCRLERIKKGKLFLRMDNSIHPYEDLIKGVFYPFLIVKETINPADNLRYLILQDEKQRKHILKKKYYAHYGLKAGQLINCKVQGLNEDGFLLLEPENPWYKEGEQYFFNTLELHKLHFSDKSVQDVILLDDPNGEPIKVFVDEDQVTFLQQKSRVTAQIKNIKKSRLEVIIQFP